MVGCGGAREYQLFHAGEALFLLYCCVSTCVSRPPRGSRKEFLFFRFVLHAFSRGAWLLVLSEAVSHVLEAR